MALTFPYGQHNYLGRFAGDAAALAFIVASGLDAGGGTPLDEQWYFDTDQNAFKIWILNSIPGGWQVISTNPRRNGGRLALDGSQLNMFADQTNSTKLWLLPYKHDRIALFNDNYWFERVITSDLLIFADGVTDTVRDVFAYWDAGTGLVTLEFDNWASDIARAAPLSIQDGVLVKNADPTRRYIGTIRTNTNGNFEDNASMRWVWNYEHRVRRSLYYEGAAASWSYGTATWRAANNDPTYNVSFVLGLLEDTVELVLSTRFANGAGAGQSSDASISMDTTAPGGFPPFVTPVRAGGAGNDLVGTAMLQYGQPNFTDPGYHVAYWVEAANLSGGANNNTFFGAEYGHLTGSILC